MTAPEGNREGGGGGGGGKKRRRRRRGGSGGGNGSGSGGGPRPPGQSGGGDRRPQGGGHKGAANGNQGSQGAKPDGRGGRDRAPATEPRNDLRVASAGQKAQKTDAPFKHVTRRYSLAFYETFAAAKADLEALAAKTKEFDQVNIVIRAEGNMDDPELVALGNVKVFAGTAWALIHERRRDDGWYDQPR